MSTQLVFFFKDQYGYGWSEKLYTNQTPTLGVLPTWLTTLINQRCMFLSSASVLTHVRIGSGVKRLPYVYTLNNGQGVTGSETVPQAASEQALMITYFGSGGGYNRIFHRGLPQRVCVGDTFVPDSTFSANILPFLNTVKGSGFYNVQGTIGSPSTQYGVSSATPQLPRGYLVVLKTGAPTLTVGQQVRMHSYKVPEYNGIKTVMQVLTTPNEYVMGGVAPPSPETGSAAYMTILTALDNVIGAYEIENLTRRAAGRPFGLSRGRRPTSVSLRQ